MFKRIKSRLLVLLLTLASQLSWSQNFDPNNFIIENYTIEDGLPSNECHAVLQDSLGYIWIATDRGLVKYDGYGFKVYGTKQGLMDLSCLNIKMDHKGDIWIHTFSNKIFIYDSKEDSIKLYQYQHLINNYLGVSKIMDFAVSKSSTFVGDLVSIGFIIIGQNGEHRIEQKRPIDSTAVYFTKRVDKELLISGTTREGGPNFSELEYLKRKKIDHNIYSLEKYFVCSDRQFNGEHDFGLYSSNLEAFVLRDSFQVLNVDGVSYFLSRDTVDIRFYKSEIEDLAECGATSILSAELNRKGIKYYSSWHDLVQNNFQCILEDVSGTKVVMDHQENIWVSSIDKGLFKISSTDFSIFPKTEEYRITNLAKSNTELYYLIDKNEIRIINEQSNNLLVLEDSFNKIHSITYDSFQNELIVNRNLSTLIKPNNTHKSINYNFRENKQSNVRSYPASFLNTFVFDEDDILSVHPDNFFIYQDLDSLPSYHSYRIEDILKVRSAYRIVKGDYILGTVNGLKRFKGNILGDLSNCPEALQIRINDIEKFQDDFIFGTQGNGVVLWDLENKAQIVDVEDGLISNNVEELFVSSEDKIFVCTKSGFSLIDGLSSSDISVQSFSIDHGLPSNEVFDIEEWKNNIYIATAKGLVEFDDSVLHQYDNEVFIEQLSVNGFDLIPEGINLLSHHDNNIRIAYKALDYSRKSSIEYRYQLNEGEWTETKSTIALFTALPAGTYTFHVMAKNRGGHWSRPTEVKFIINPPWWRTWWFYILTFLIILFIAYYLVKQRELRLTTKNKLELEIVNLERSALQAQMNPHFIFNCLNSIQNFIMKNEKEEAMDYLTKFAQLIRSNLNASVNQKITLYEEERMLSNYLELERLRLNNRFNYEMIFDQVISKELIEIAPMLIQPYVENAVIHGMVNLEKDGLIQITFKLKDGQLEVSVMDNGDGVSKNRNNKVHKSLGMSITQKRLEIINNYKEIEVTPESTLNGTQINIFIPLDS